MRRLAALTLTLALATGVVAASATGDDSHSYSVELDNAFGLVEGSDVRIAGVIAGAVTGVSITPEKRALVEIETTGPLAELGTDTICSSEPQSLIAEYFLDCSPDGPPLADGGTIPVEQTRQTVQQDIFQNMTRLPHRERLALIVNEFGSGLAGNGTNLNDVIRRGAPALANLERALDILADEHRTIARLNSDGDRIIARLAERRDDVVRFIGEAGEAAEATAERRTDFARDLDQLDDFIAELRPALSELDRLGVSGTPVLARLREASPPLTSLGASLPPFARSSELSLSELGEAAKTGRRALSEGADEIRILARAGADLRPTFEPLTDFLRDLDDPRRAVEVDARAARSCDDPERACWSTGREAPTGYTGFEGILNYVYYLTGATSQYDTVGHMLHFSLFDVGAGPCGSFRPAGEPGTPEFGVPAAGGGFTTEILEAHPCVSWVGPNQYGINQRVGELPPYDPSVCDAGSAALDVCDPAGGARAPARKRTGARPAAELAPQGAGARRGARRNISGLLDYLVGD